MNYCFFRFVVTGCFATSLHYLLIYLCIRFFDVSVWIASGIGYVFGSILSYIMNYFYTFSSSENHFYAVWRFYLMVVFGLIVNITVVVLFADMLKFNKWIVQIFATSIVLIINFIISKKWVYRFK